MAQFDKMLQESMSADANYDQRKGTKLKIVYPSSAVADFDFMKATGAIDVEIAHFGRFQTGTSI